MRAVSLLEIQKIYNDIYALMILFLFFNSATAAYVFGAAGVVPQMLLAVGTAVAADLLIKYFRFHSITFPKTAIISGLFIGGILEMNQPWFIPVAAALIAIFSKHIFNFNNKHIFNPANFALLLLPMIFKTSPSWLLAVHPLSILLGLVIVWRFQRFHQVIPFLLVYFTLFSAFNNSTAALADFVVYFFSFYMMIEPKSSPTSRNGRIVYGALAGALVFFGRFYWAANPIFAGLFVANILVILINKFVR